MRDLFKLVESKTNSTLLGEETLVFKTENHAYRAIELAEGAGFWADVDFTDGRHWYVSTDKVENIEKWKEICTESKIPVADSKTITEANQHETTIKFRRKYGLDKALELSEQNFVVSEAKDRYIKAVGTQIELEGLEQDLRENNVEYRIVETTTYVPMKSIAEGSQEEVEQMMDRNPEIANKILRLLKQDEKQPRQDGGGKAVLRDDLEEAAEENNINRSRGTLTQYNTYAGDEMSTDHEKFKVDMDVKGDKSVIDQQVDDNNKEVEEPHVATGRNDTGSDSKGMFDSLLGRDNPAIADATYAPDDRNKNKPITIGSGGGKDEGDVTDNDSGADTNTDETPAKADNDSNDGTGKKEDGIEKNINSRSGSSMSSKKPTEDGANEEVPSSFKPKKNVDGSKFDDVKKNQDAETEGPKEKDESRDDVEKSDNDDSGDFRKHPKGKGGSDKPKADKPGAEKKDDDKPKDDNPKAEKDDDKDDDDEVKESEEVDEDDAVVDEDLDESDEDVVEETKTKAEFKVEIADSLEQQVVETKRNLKQQKLIRIVAEGVGTRNWSKFTRVDLRKEKVQLLKLSEKAVGKNKTALVAALNNIESILK